MEEFNPFTHCAEVYIRKDFGYNLYVIYGGVEKEESNKRNTFNSEEIRTRKA